MPRSARAGVGSRSRSSRRSPGGSRAGSNGRESSVPAPTPPEPATPDRPRVQPCRARLLDRRRAARGRTRLPAVRPSPSDEPPARLRSRSLRGQRRQEPEHGREGSRPSRADRLGGRAGCLGPRPRGRLPPDDSGRALRAGDALPCDREGARDRLARIGTRRPDHAEGSRRVRRSAARPALHERDRGLDPPRTPSSAGWQRYLSTSCSSAARGSRSPCSCPIARSTGPRSSPARCCSASGCCSSMPSTSTSRPAWSRAEPIPTARSASRPPCSSRWCS